MTSPGAGSSDASTGDISDETFCLLASRPAEALASRALWANSWMRLLHRTGAGSGGRSGELTWAVEAEEAEHAETSESGVEGMAVDALDASPACCPGPSTPKSPLLGLCMDNDAKRDGHLSPIAYVRSYLCP
mmetsp:Transcript_43107/g.99857  ORF Transcript_43107/g.99857 Transcript_43107/m.99857 type:complete len:132 (+) Transcript_43107:241-636(+)